MTLTGEAKRQYQREWIANRRAAFFKGKSCVKCGATEDLNLDHIDPQQKISHSIWSWSAARREIEIAKCQVLCVPCHKVKTAEDMKWVQHGNQYHYSKLGCRCVECTEAHRIAAQKWRENARAKNAGRESNPLPLG